MAPSVPEVRGRNRTYAFGTTTRHSTIKLHAHSILKKNILLNNKELSLNTYLYLLLFIRAFIEKKLHKKVGV